MDFETYLQGIENLKNVFETERRKLIKIYVDHNNPHKVGEIIHDHIGSIRIEKIGYYISYEKPEATYTGVELLKNGTPNKKGNKRTIYQQNLKIGN